MSISFLRLNHSRRRVDNQLRKIGQLETDKLPKLGSLLGQLLIRVKAARKLMNTLIPRETRFLRNRYRALEETLNHLNESPEALNRFFTLFVERESTVDAGRDVEDLIRQLATDIHRPLVNGE